MFSANGGLRILKEDHWNMTKTHATKKVATKMSVKSYFLNIIGGIESFGEFSHFGFDVSAPERYIR